MKIITRSLFFFYVFLLFSCGSRNSQFVSQIENLEESLQKVEHSLAGIDTSKIGNYLRKSTENLKFIQENYKDTMDKETAFMASDYSATRKSMYRFLENYGDVIKEISYSHAQLSALKSDVENNAVEEQRFNDYFGVEEKSVQKLDELTKNINEWYASAIRMYEERHPAIEKFVQQLRGEQMSN